MSDTVDQLALSLFAPPATEDELLVPARMVNEWVYCPRLAVLEWGHGEWAGNADTAAGRRAHRATEDGRAPALPSPEALGEDQALKTRRLLLASERLGFTAEIDVVARPGLIEAPSSAPQFSHRAPPTPGRAPGASTYPYLPMATVKATSAADYTAQLGGRLTGALLDRLTHHVHILAMNGESYRLKQSAGRRQRAGRAEQNKATNALADEPADEPDNAATAAPD